jgi:hypothetical protein
MARSIISRMKARKRDEEAARVEVAVEAQAAPAPDEVLAPPQVDAPVTRAEIAQMIAVAIAKYAPRQKRTTKAKRRRVS